MLNINSGQDVTIDLNGYVLDLSKTYLNVFGSDGTKITIQDSNPTRVHSDTNLAPGGLVSNGYIGLQNPSSGDKPSLIMTGGTLASNTTITSVNSNNKLIVSENAKIYSYFANIGCNITIHANGGIIYSYIHPSDTIKIVNSDSEVTSFYGEVNSQNISAGIFYNLGEYAKINEDAITVTFKNGDDVLATQVVTEGDKVKNIDDPTSSTLLFTGWWNEDGTKFDFNTAITEDITIYAGWIDPKATGANGKDGVNGINGKDCISITKATINENGELVLTYSNGNTDNLGQVVGKDGKDGTDGLTPYIGDNGNWWIGEKDTEVKAVYDDHFLLLITLIGLSLLTNCGLILYLILKNKKQED